MIASLLLLLPLLGAALIAFGPAGRRDLAGARAGSRIGPHWIAAVCTLVTAAVGVGAALQFEGWRDGGFGLHAGVDWLADLGITLNMHVDAVSLLLILLTLLLMPLCIFASFSAITARQREYYGWLLVLQAAMTGVFLARDLVFFYICFEFTLVPMYFLIAIYGGENRARAALKFFIYTFTGSMLTLAGLLWVAWAHADRMGTWTFDIPTLTSFAQSGLSSGEQAWILLALMAGFAVKVPLFPVHTWLPLAHTEAPTAGSVILAGVLLKLGTYGLYRFVLPMVPDAVVAYAPFIAVLAIVGIVYGALICWVQDDVKKLVAYSSVSHLGFCVLGLFALNPIGVQGSVLYMINHGLSTGALFLLIGMMYERHHTRDMNRIGGLARVMPVWSLFMVFFVLSSVGLPGLNGFVSEFYCLLGAFTASADAPTGYPGRLGPWYAAFAGTGMILAAMYLLIMTGKVVFGPAHLPGGHGHGGHGAETHGDGGALPPDLTRREIGVLMPIALLCIVLGVRPGLLTDALARPIEQALAASAAASAAASVARPLDADTDGDTRHAGASGVADEAGDDPPRAQAANEAGDAVRERIRG